MVQKPISPIQNEKGMTLIEVIIATMLFSFFILAFMQGQGANILSSSRIKQDLMLKDLAEMKINELIINPPEFQESLTSAGKETKKFEDFPDYQYTVEFKKISVPDYTKLTGEQDDETENSAAKQLEKRIFGVVKENLEKIIWQVQVTVENKETEEIFELSSWIHNPQAKVQINGL